MKIFPLYSQPDAMDCGPTCLRMIAKHYGRPVSLLELRALSETTREGSSLLGLSEAAEKIGFRSLGVKVSFQIIWKVSGIPRYILIDKQGKIVNAFVQQRKYNELKKLIESVH